MKDLFKNYILKNRKYYISTCMAYYLCPFLMFLGYTDLIVLLAFSKIYIPLTVLTVSAIFSANNHFQWYFSAFIAILWLPVLLIRFDFIIIMGILFVVSVFGQSLGMIVYKFFNSKS